MIPVLAIGGAVAIIGGAIYASIAAEKKRTEELQRAAAMLGLSFQETCTDMELGPLAGELPLFDRGHSRRANRLMRGRLNGQDVVLLDYRYTTGSGKNQHTHRQTLLLCDAGEGVPDFTLGPENFFHRVASALGYQDIDFEDTPEFSKAYLLRGPDESAIRAHVTPDARMFLGGMPGWHVETQGGRMAVYRDSYAKPAELGPYANDAVRVAGALRRRS